MSTASMSFGRATHAGMPRGSVWFGNAAAALIMFLRKLDKWELKQVRRQPQSREDVLAWARQLEASDPGFASDLRAAVYRSEIDEQR